MDGAEGYFAMNWWRIYKITTETGAVINVNYSGKQCVAGSPPPASEANTQRCFPVYWTLPFQATPTLDYFHVDGAVPFGYRQAHDFASFVGQALHGREVAHQLLQ